MRRVGILAIALTCLLGLGFAIVGVFGAFSRRGSKPQKRVEAFQRLVSQNIKIGDTPQRVIEFLDAQHLEHAQLMKPDFMYISGHDYANQNVIEAIKRHTALGMFWDEAIQLVFVFNEKRELTRIDVLPVYTSF